MSNVAGIILLTNVIVKRTPALTNSSRSRGTQRKKMKPEDGSTTTKEVYAHYYVMTSSYYDVSDTDDAL